MGAVRCEATAQRVAVELNDKSLKTCSSHAIAYEATMVTNSIGSDWYTLSAMSVFTL